MSMIDRHTVAIFRVLLVVNAVIWAMLAVLFVVDAVIWAVFAVLLMVEGVPRSVTRVLLVCHLMVGSFREMFFPGFMHGVGDVMPLRTPAVPIHNALHFGLIDKEYFHCKMNLINTVNTKTFDI